ncbi:metal-dependent hydrolase [Candidatus Woesearchaeota archaeon]|nr:metal-dependent hydrolase [Candidatus Woesearchaeota archaeon]
MPFASGHIIGGYILGKIAEKARKIPFSHYAWFFIIFGALLPDADFILEWVFNYDVHRTFTHSLFFVIVAPLCIYLFFKIVKHKEARIFALALGLGITSHLLLDVVSDKGIPFLWPSEYHISTYNGIYLAQPTPSFLDAPAESLRHFLKLAVLDMALGTTFLFYLWWKKKLVFSQKSS